MSTRIKLNVKNVILGCHNFSDILATHDTRVLSSLYRLVLPRAIPVCRPDFEHYKQTFVRGSTSNKEEALSRKLENLSLKWVSSEKPVTSKQLDEVQTSPICTPGSGLPWESPYSFYYDQKNPKCPVKPKCLPYPPCPPTLKSNPYKEPIKSDPFAESIPYALKTVSLNICRFYAANPCKPRRRTRKVKACKRNPCGPKRVECRPVPECPTKKKSRWKNYCAPEPEIRPVAPPRGGKQLSGPKPPRVQCQPKSPKPKC